MDIATILSWFKRGCKPTEAQFAATFKSFRHKDDKVPMEDVEGLAYAIATKANTGHTHTLAEIIDYDGGDKEVINAMVAENAEELETFTKTVGMYYIQLDDVLLYRYDHDEDAGTDMLNEVEPDGKVVYKAYDADENLHIYLYNVPNMEFQDVTDQQVDKTIYTSDLDNLILRQLEKGVYSVVYINSDQEGNTFGDAYTLTVGDGSISSRVLECRTGWAQTILVDENYQWQWHRYSYNGHTHQMSDVEGLGVALEGKAAANHNHDGVYQPAGSYAAANHNHDTAYAAKNHNHDGVYQPAGNYAAADHTHSQYLTQHQDISGKQDKTDNSLLTTVKTIVGAINELWNKFADYLKGIQHVTYAQLVTIRNNSGLVAGQWYRITDYMTTVANDTEARSAGHPFDLLVMATSSNTLSEEAKAIKSSRDSNGYFADANLNAWKVWYCLDNDTTRFQWADTENGKGVIWRMIDEWQNDIPFDFKNVQVKRYKVYDSRIEGEDEESNEAYLNDQYVGYLGLDDDNLPLSIPDYDDFIWAYVFNTEDGQDLSVCAASALHGADYARRCFGGSVIKPYRSFMTRDEECTIGTQSINSIVLCMTENVHNVCAGNFIESECCNMTFMSATGMKLGYDSRDMVADINFNGNTLGGGHAGVLFGKNIDGVTFGSDYWNGITFGSNYSWGVTFGSNYHDGITFGSYYYYGVTFGSNYGNGVTFGSDYRYGITFGSNYGGGITFGSGYYDGVTFGSGYYNGVTFGSDYHDGITFGSGYHDGVTFGSNYGNGVTFGSNYWNGITFGSYLRGISFGSNLHYINVPGGSQDPEYFTIQYVQNAYILNGTSGTDDEHILQISFQKDTNYCQYAGLNSSGNLRIWTPADAA